MTAAELEKAIEQARKACEAAHVDCRPWQSNGHPLSLAHWQLIQQRQSKSDRKGRQMTPEQARAARQAREAKRAQKASRRDFQHIETRATSAMASQADTKTSSSEATALPLLWPSAEPRL